jgi:hypothetical protein
MIMKTRVNAIALVAALVCLVPAAAFALTPYTEDFESLNQADAGALGNAGWLVFANVFGPDWAYWYGYGVFPAPNGSGGFCNVAVGEGGASQGMQQMVVFSDYNNTDHGVGAYIESLVFQEQPIGAGDVGETWRFSFDAKLGDLAGASTAAAFIKTLDPNAGYATTNYIPLDMTGIPGTWSSYSIDLFIDGSLDGQLFQIGFSNVASNYEPSGVFYDNIDFRNVGVVPADPATWGDVKALYR